MSKKPIWTWHGDVAVQLEYALPYLQKALGLCQSAVDTIILEKICAEVELMKISNHNANKVLIEE